MARVSRALTAAALLALAWAVLPAAASARGTVHQLSNETSFTRWAHPVEIGPIYAAPSVHARRVGRLKLETAEGYPEVYVLLDSFSDPRGEEWIKVRFSGRPNGKTGWVPRERLGSFQHTRWSIAVDLARHRMFVSFAGRRLRSFPVGVGKRSTPTPTGHFWIVERIRVAERSNPYWPYALGTSDYSTLRNWPAEGVVGIHGPFGEEWAIPGNPSHGCIRMRQGDISWLGPRVTVGTPVQVLP